MKEAVKFLLTQVVLFHNDPAMVKFASQHILAVEAEFSQFESVTGELLQYSGPTLAELVAAEFDKRQSNITVESGSDTEPAKNIDDSAAKATQKAK